MNPRLAIVMLIVTVQPAGVSLASEYELRHDPFARPAAVRKPAGGSVSSTNDVELRGIIQDGAGSLANINGRILRLHDEIDGYRLTKIERDRVSLVRNSTTTILTIDSHEH